VLAAELGGDTALNARMKGQLSTVLAEAILPNAAGRLQEAVALGKQAVAMSEVASDSEQTSWLRTNLALAMARLTKISSVPELLDEAHTAVSEAIRVREQGRSLIDVAYSYSTRGLVLLRKFEVHDNVQALDASIHDYSRALQIALNDGTDAALIGSVATDLAAAELLAARRGRQGLVADAEQHARIATEGDGIGDFRRGLAFGTLAESLDLLHRVEEVLPALIQACQLLQPDWDPDRYRRLAHWAATLLAKERRWTAAADLFERVMLTEPISGDDWSQHVPEEPESVMASYRNAGRWAAYCCARAGQLPRAVEILEAGRCRHSGRTIREEAATLDALRQHDSSLAERFTTARTVAAEATTVEVKAAARAQLRAVIEEVRHAGHPAFLRRQGLVEFASDLDQRDPLVYLLSSPWGSLSIIVTGPKAEDLFPVWADRLSSLDVVALVWGITPEKTVYKTGLALANGSQLRAHLDVILPEVGSKLMKSLTEQLLAIGVARVTLVPTGLLSWLPLHAATFDDNGETVCLWTKMPVRHLPAAAFRLASKPTNRSRTFVGIADPGGARRLPGSRAEVLAALRLYDGDAHVVFGSAATRVFLRNCLLNPVDIHIACHAGPPEGIGVGGIVLHLADGQLTLGELESIGRRHGIGLVVAAACSSGTPDVSASPEEAWQLSTGFLNCGAAGVVTALWPIDDRGTSLLMYKYYQNLAIQGLDSSSALREAAIWLSGADRSELKTMRKELKGLAKEAGEVRVATSVPSRFRRAVAAGRTGNDGRPLPPRRLAARFRLRTWPYAHPYYWACLVYSGEPTFLGRT